MSDNVTSIKKAWNAKTESVCIDLALLTQALENRKHTYASNNSIQAALTQEIEIVSNITQKVNSATPIDSTYIKELEDKLTKIEGIYNEQDAGAHDDFLNRRSIIRATISHTNKLIKDQTSNSTKAEKVKSIPDIPKNNARVTLDNLAWHETMEIAEKCRTIRAGMSLELFAINDLKDKIKDGAMLDAQTYGMVVMQFRLAHEKYLFSESVEAEFAARQTLLTGPLRTLFEHHADNNLFTTKDLTELNKERDAKTLTPLGELILNTLTAPQQKKPHTFTLIEGGKAPQQP